MKYFSFLSLFILSIFITNAQSDFNNMYFIGSGSNKIGNIIFSQDTLYASGFAFSDNPPYIQELFFAKLDTIGNLLSMNKYRDSLNRHYTLSNPNGFIELSNQTGFLILTGSFQEQKGIIHKIDRAGNQIFVSEPELNNVLTSFFRRVIETDSGYLIFGFKQTLDFQQKAIMFKIDFNGNLLWEKEVFTVPNRWVYFGSVLPIHDNEYLISGTTLKSENVPTEDKTYIGWIMSVDSLGNQNWIKETEEGLDELGIGHFHITEEGHYVYNTGRATYIPAWNELDITPLLIKRDSSTFEVVEEKEIYTPELGNNFLGHSLILDDGNWLIMGVMIGSLDIPPDFSPNAQFGTLHKTNFAFDSIWMRRDTAHWSFTSGSNNRLHAVVELPSGSLIAGGFNIDNDTGFQRGWLIKVDKNGCMDTLNCVLPVVVKEVPERKNKIMIYPNPATDQITFAISSPIKIGTKINLYNNLGMLIKSIDLGESQMQTSIDVNDLPSGIYFAQIINKEKILDFTKFIVLK